MNASKLFNQKRPFSCTVTEKGRQAVRDLARMRGEPVCAFFTTSGAVWVESMSPTATHGFIIAYDGDGKEIKEQEVRR